MLLEGKPEEALEAYAHQPPPDGHTPTWLSGQAMAWHDLEDASQAQAFLGELIDEWGEDSPRIMARTLAWPGQRDQAFEWLERVNKIEMLQVAFNPLFADLHDDPRWLALLERVEMGPQQLVELEFNPQFSGE